MVGTVNTVSVVSVVTAFTAASVVSVVSAISMVSVASALHQRSEHYFSDCIMQVKVTKSTKNLMYGCIMEVRHRDRKSVV